MIVEPGNPRRGEKHEDAAVPQTLPRSLAVVPIPQKQQQQQQPQLQHEPLGRFALPVPVAMPRCELALLLVPILTCCPSFSSSQNLLDFSCIDAVHLDAVGR